MALRGVLVAALASLCVLGLIEPSTGEPLAWVPNSNDDVLQLVSSIDGMAKNMAYHTKDAARTLSRAILSQQEILQELLSAFLNQSEPSSCQPCQPCEPCHNDTSELVCEKEQERSNDEEELIQLMGAMETILMKSEEVSSEVECSHPYERHGSECLFISKEKELTWRDALIFCMTHGGTLPLASLIEAIPRHQTVRFPGKFWMGSSDVKREGDYRWLTGDKMDMYKVWYGGQPNGGAEDCVMYEYEYPGFHDYPCGAEYPFICSKIF